MTDKNRSSHSWKSAEVKSDDTDHSASLHPSLTAPRLSRAISVDNYANNIIHETPQDTAPTVTPSRTLMASSESDGDENEDRIAQLPPNQSRRRRSTAANYVKRSRSQLSLESCPSNAETTAPKLPLKRVKRVVNPAVPTMSQHSGPKDPKPSSVLRAAAQLSPPSGTLPSTHPNKATVERHLASHDRPSVISTPSTMPRHHGPTTARVPVAIPSTSPPVPLQKPSALNLATSSAIAHSTPDTPYREMHTSVPLSNSRTEPLETKSSSKALPTPPATSGISPIASQKSQPAIPPKQPDASSSPRDGTSDDIEVVAVRIAKPSSTTVAPLDVLRTASYNQSRTRVYSDPLLVNIAPLDISDNFSWERLVFFIHHPRRFEFSFGAHISELSPFSGLTLNMDHAQPSSVCAVCGAGAALRECPRCTLGFHPVCVHRSRRHQTSALCVACTSMTVNNNSSQWGVAFVPPSLPPPERALPRLIADAQQGNPIDLILIPSLFNFYVNNVGSDWLRCYKCNGIRILCGGAISESVCIPFDCSRAFWDPEHLRNCSSASAMGVQERTKIEKHLEKRARLKTSMRYFMLGEEDRADFGFKRIPSEMDGINFSAQPAETQRHFLAGDSITFDANGNRPRVAAVKEDIEIVGNHRSQLKQVSSNDSYGNAVPKFNSNDLNFGRLPPANGPKIGANASLGSENCLAVITDGQREMPNGAVSHGANSSVGPNAVVGLNRNDNIAHREENGNRSGIKVRLLQDIGSMNFDPAIEDALMELALAGNEHLMNLYVAFGQSPAHVKRFKRQAVLLASRSKLHSRIIRSATGAHTPHGLVMNRGLPGTMKNGTNMATSIPLVGMAQRRIQLGASFKEFRLGQLRSELQLCSNVINQLTETAPQNVAAVHSHTYSQIVAVREKHENEIRAYLERLAGLQVVQHRQGGNFSRQPTQVHPQRQAETPQHTFRHSQGVAKPQQEHFGLQSHHERRV